jgi:hypothetical protein
VIILDRLLIGGIGFVLDKLAAAADQELYDEDGLREELLGAQMRFELGEIDEAEFAALENDLLARLREVRRQREAAAAGPAAEEGAAEATQALSLSSGRSGQKVIGVEVDYGGEEEKP